MTRDRLEIGMDVWTDDGHMMGEVVSMGPDGFMIGNGANSIGRYRAKYQYIDRFFDDSVVLCLNRELLSTLGDDDTSSPAPEAVSPPDGAEHAAQAGASMKTEAMPIAERTEPDATRLDAENELRLPLAEERIEVNRIVEEVGRVRVHKTIRTENQHLSVPVMHEEVRIEHIAALERSASSAGSMTEFHEETLSIPLYEERVEVIKHPVVREEVVVVKVAKLVKQEIDASVRTETADVQEEYVARRGGKLDAA